MGDIAKYPVLPELSTIDFSDIADVRDLVRARARLMFGPHEDAYIDDHMEAIARLFSGRHPGYQAIDTGYHDIRHTLQATLCLVELLSNRHISGAGPKVPLQDFKRTFVAVLFHDSGYLKAVGDNRGTGAKYTHVHERRSCRLVRIHLSESGWSPDDIQFVENLIGATGPFADLTKIEFRSDMERLMGQAVCTADYVGQMSDPDYPEKLETLFGEFAESYHYQRIPKRNWPFATYEDLLRGTPGFWGSFVHRKMTVECDGFWKYLENPVTGRNPYIESVERNLASIRRQIGKLGDRNRGISVLRAAKSVSAP